MTVRQTARGIGIRALILVLAVVIVGVWLTLKVIGAAIDIAIWGALFVIAAVAIAVIAYRLKRRV